MTKDFEKEKEKSTTVQKFLDERNSDLEKISKDFEKEKEKSTTLQKSLDERNSDLENMSQDFEKEKEKSTTLQKSLDERNSDLEKMIEDFEKEKEKSTYLQSYLDKKTGELKNEKTNIVKLQISLDQQKEKKECFEYALHHHGKVVPTLVAIGLSGVGKSQLCNVLAGKEFNDDLFPKYEKPNITKKWVKWNGDGQPIWLIDTPWLKGTP